MSSVIAYLDPLCICGRVCAHDPFPAHTCTLQTYEGLETSLLWNDDPVYCTHIHALEHVLRSDCVLARTAVCTHTQ